MGVGNPTQDPDEAVKAEPATAAPDTDGKAVFAGAAVTAAVAAETAVTGLTELVAVT